MNRINHMNRRHILAGLMGALFTIPKANAQMSQRARQIQDRRACEQDMPQCKADIRLQLDAERRRMGIGLSFLAAGLGIVGLLLFRRYQRMKKEVDSKAEQLRRRLSGDAGDSSNNQAV